MTEAAAHVQVLAFASAVSTAFASASLSMHEFLTFHGL